MAEMQRLGITPILDLMHFGVPDWLGNFQNPDIPVHFADYCEQVAKRYPWVRYYTPSESAEFIHELHAEHTPAVQLENLLRFTSLDLLYAHHPEGEVVNYLYDNGMTRQEYDWFMAGEPPGYQWVNILRIRKEGVPVLGFTWYSLIDQIDWEKGLAEKNGTLEELGEAGESDFNPVNPKPNYRDKAIGWQKNVPPDSSRIRYSVFLIGDVGNPIPAAKG
nr:hypothetical protein [Tanacetum cinerariifolium]